MATTDVDQRVTRALRDVGPRLRSWLRRRLPQAADVEDVYQDVFYEFVLAQRAAQPIVDAAAWLFRVARNRLIDRARTVGSMNAATAEVDLDADAQAALENLLPDPRAGPEARYAHQLLLAELEAALAALPAPQREVFLAHELEGQSFAQLAERTGVGINTLLARKHYAVKFLRRRLQQAHDEWLD